MKVDEFLANATNTMAARCVYAEPVERAGITIVAAAAIAGGGGGGSGTDDTGKKGSGGGFGVGAKPVGAYVIKDGRVMWRPALDINRLITVLGAVAVAALVVGAAPRRHRPGN
jgi:uncharacterized spore protein YtfJ